MSDVEYHYFKKPSIILGSADRSQLSSNPTFRGSLFHGHVVMPLPSYVAPLGAVLLISGLAYGSQIYFAISEDRLERNQAIRFNILVGCIWISYIRACVVDPGRIPGDWLKRSLHGPEGSISEFERSASNHGRGRLCRKCGIAKPPRAHHCKTCKRYTFHLPSIRQEVSEFLGPPPRCIPKMDHHCPWTVKCVSYGTFPHFMRFLFYAVASMMYLEYFLYLRASVIWSKRHLPSVGSPNLASKNHRLDDFAVPWALGRQHDIPLYLYSRRLHHTLRRRYHASAISVVPLH